MEIIVFMLFIYLVPVLIVAYFHSWFVISAFGALFLILYNFRWVIINASERGAIFFGPLISIFLFGLAFGIVGRIALNLMARKKFITLNYSIFVGIIILPPVFFIIINREKLLSIIQ